MAELIVAIVGLAISLMAGGISIADSHLTGKIKSTIGKEVVRLADILKNKNIKLADLQHAYNDKSGKLATILMQSAGLGARAAALKAAIKDNDAKYKSDLHQINTEIADAQTKMNNLNEIQSNTNTMADVAAKGGMGNKSKLEQSLNLTGYSYDLGSDKLSNLDQNINGGMKE